jgi:hypothetical protein
MISHVVLGDVAAERSATLRLQAEEFRRRRRIRLVRNVVAMPDRECHGGVVASADLGRSSRRSTRDPRTV